MMQCFIPSWDGICVGHDSPWQDSAVKHIGMKAEDLAVAVPYFPQELRIWLILLKLNKIHILETDLL